MCRKRWRLASRAAYSGRMHFHSFSLKNWHRWLLVALFAIAMAWMESATVFYLRAKLERLEPNQTNPLPHPAPVGVLSFGNIEITREAATLTMLLIVGWLAGRNTRTRWAYRLVAFGVWDVFYYVFLWPMSGWPRTLWDWDVLFLIPLPWWGPVLAPVLIALLMVLGGTLISQFDSDARPLWPQRLSLSLNFLGVGVALYAFMADAIAVLLKWRQRRGRAND
ncbi:MAG: hypothetical protein JNL09_06805 [Anaerolineales bacterium]|nr:hypothetical protein [Anaerolineales bacterium]